MKILHINSLYHPNLVGGAERNVRFLAEAQAQRGHALVVVTLSPNPGVVTDTVDGVKVYSVGLQNLYWPFRKESPSVFAKSLWHAIDSYNWRMAQSVARIYQHEKPDLVHTHNLTGFSRAVWKWPLQHRLPVVHSAHDYSLLCPKTTMFSGGENCRQQHLICKGFSYFGSHFSQNVHAVTAVSRFTLDRHVAAGLFTSVPVKKVIHSCRSLRTGRTINLDSGRSGALRVGFIGQLTPAKGVELLLEVASQLPEQNYGWHIAGRGHLDYENHLKSRFNRPNIQFLGFIEPDAFFAQIDLLVVPSLWHDPGPGVIIEAYDSGLPVVASRRGGISEMVEDRQTGLLFEPGRPEELKANLERFDKDRQLLEEMRARCRQKATEFSAERACELFETVYQKIERSREWKEPAGDLQGDGLVDPNA